MALQDTMETHMQVRSYTLFVSQEWEPNDENLLYATRTTQQVTMSGTMDIGHWV